MLDNLKDKKILILGFGREGQSTFSFLKRLFPKKILGVADRKELSQFSANEQKLLKSSAVNIFLGKNYLDSVFDYDFVVKTPGIPLSLTPLQKARRKGVIISSQTKIFFENCPGKIIGVTGTKGKSTTASMIFQILREAGMPVKLLGNIEIPAIDFLLNAKADEIFVYELSSHQLVDLEKSPYIAVLLNIFREHLDYYESFQEYAAAKENITRFQTASDYLIYNNSLSILEKIAARSWARKLPFGLKDTGKEVCFLENEWLSCRLSGKKNKIIRRREIPLRGDFNLYNVMPGIIIAQLYNISNKNIVSAVKKFKSLPHRLEFCGEFKGISFYDDSISTIPESAIAAIRALGTNVQTILLGGFERNQDFTELAKEILSRKHIKNLILFPSTGKRIWEKIQEIKNKNESLPKSYFVKDMIQAIKIAFLNTEKNRIVLLSPASPSFSVFKDYKDRGNQFQKYARHLGSFPDFNPRIHK